MRFFKNTLLIILLLLLCECNNCNCEGISVSEVLLVSADNKGYKYCATLREAVKGNEDSVRKISTYDFGAASGYDHGDVLVQLIKKIGEDNYIKIIRQLDAQSRKTIAGYILVGVEYGNNELPKKVYDFCMNPDSANLQSIPKK